VFLRLDREGYSWWLEKLYYQFDLVIFMCNKKEWEQSFQSKQIYVEADDNAQILDKAQTRRERFKQAKKEVSKWNS